MNGRKNIIQSKTLWGAVVSGLSAIVSGVFGFEVAPGEEEALVHGLAAVGSVIGLATTIYGRWTARAQIG